MSQFNVAFESTNNNFRTEFTNNAVNFNMSFDKVVKVVPNVYEGQYEITPTTELQTLNTKQLVMIDNVTINPIPSNYGEIIWDGSTLTVR